MSSNIMISCHAAGIESQTFTFNNDVTFFYFDYPELHHKLAVKAFQNLTAMGGNEADLMNYWDELKYEKNVKYGVDTYKRGQKIPEYAVWDLNTIYNDSGVFNLNVKFNNNYNKNAQFMRKIDWNNRYVHLSTLINEIFNKPQYKYNPINFYWLACNKKY